MEVTVLLNDMYYVFNNQEEADLFVAASALSGEDISTLAYLVS